MNKYIKIIQKLKNELNSTNQKYLDLVKEVRLKNKIISDLQNGIYIKDINIEKYKDELNDNTIISNNEQIKNIQKEFFEEVEEKVDNDIDKINQNELENMDKNAQIQILMNNINSFSEKLNEYKMNNMQEIINLRNLLESNNNSNNNNNNFNIKDQYYLNIIDMIKNLCTNMSNNSNKIENFPNFSLNDDNEIKYKNIFITIKILADYIISNNNINEELNKRLKEMSELLIKSNENLSKSRNDNIELKRKYKELESNYNSIN